MEWYEALDGEARTVVNVMLGMAYLVDGEWDNRSMMVRPTRQQWGLV